MLADRQQQCKLKFRTFYLISFPLKRKLMSTPEKVAKPRKNSAFQHLMTVHWWMAACYLMLFTTGPLMAPLPREFFIRDPMYDFHKLMGTLTIAILTWRILTLLRVWWKKYTRHFPKFTLQWMKKVALYGFLYMFMWAVPVSGIFFSGSYPIKDIHFFWVIKLPDLFGQNSNLLRMGGNIHFWLSYAFLAFIILHSIDQWKVVRANWRRFIGFIQGKQRKS